MFEQRTRSEAIDVSPNMRGICRGSSEVGGGVDVGISFEENITVARFYWLPVFNLRQHPLVSALSGPNMRLFSHDLYVNLGACKVQCIMHKQGESSKITSR